MGRVTSAACTKLETLAGSAFIFIRQLRHRIDLVVPSRADK